MPRGQLITHNGFDWGEPRKPYEGGTPCTSMANESVEVTLSVPADVTLDDLLVTEDTEIVDVSSDRLTETIEETSSDESEETRFEEGEYYLDPKGPTPSPEKNTVRVTNIPGDRIDEHTIGSSDETVYEYTDRRYDPSEPVVEAVYSNLNTDKTYSFPASRLREV